MTNKSTIILAIFSMIICIAIMAGTSYAWFTDTVSTGVNRITLGTGTMQTDATDAPADPTDAPADPDVPQTP